MAELYKVFVGNLSYNASIDDVRDAFKDFNVLDAVIINDKETQRSRGFGFVTLTCQEDIEQAKKQLNGYSLLGRPLTVNDAQNKRPQQQQRFNNSSRGYNDGYQGGSQGGWQNQQAGGGYGSGYQQSDGGSYYQQQNSYGGSGYQNRQGGQGRFDNY